jgi:hypothetical protein
VKLGVSNEEVAEALGVAIYLNTGAAMGLQHTCARRHGQTEARLTTNHTNHIDRSSYMLKGNGFIYFQF